MCELDYSEAEFKEGDDVWYKPRCGSIQKGVITYVGNKDCRLTYDVLLTDNTERWGYGYQFERR